MVWEEIDDVTTETVHNSIDTSTSKSHVKENYTLSDDKMDNKIDKKIKIDESDDAIEKTDKADKKTTAKSKPVKKATIAVNQKSMTSFFTKK